MTVSSPLKLLNFDANLACEFLGVFARYEYALKAAGFAAGDPVQPAWDTYAKSIDPVFSKISDKAFHQAVEYLLTKPPKKQVLRAGKLEWETTPFDNVPRAQKVLTMVRRVRNNLFHGGKFFPTEAGGDP